MKEIKNDNKTNEYNYTAYIHINKINNKKYIGITRQNIKYRWSNGKGYKGCTYFYNAIKKYGWNNFEHIILFENMSFEVACLLEIELIKLFNTTNKSFGYNIEGGGNINKIVSQESKEKMSANLKGKYKGENNKLYGRKLPEETKRKISDAHKGKHIGELNNMYGNKYTQEEKEIMSKNMKGKYIGKDNKNSKKIICTTTGEIFDSMTEASLYYNTYPSNISACCKGKAKCAGSLENGTKLQWSYYDNEKTYEKKEYIYSAKKPVLCVTTGIIFNSLKEAGIFYNIRSTDIGACCRGKQNSAGKLNGEKLVWSYL